MRLPARFRNRWVYAGTASFLGTLVAIIVVKLLYFETLMIAVATFSAALAAWMCWPKTSLRNKMRMMTAGLLTVAFSFFIAGIVSTIIELIRQSFTMDIGLMIALPFGAVFIGSIFTFGIPYIIGMLAYLLFVEDLSQENTL